MRLFSLEQSVQELRADMERKSTELFQQVDSLAKTVQRLEQVAGQNERSETQAAGANTCSCPQLRQVVSLTLVELENLTRRANDAFDRSASSSIKQIQELQQLAGNVALRGSPGIELPVPAKRAEADDAASDHSEATYCSPSMRPRGELSPATLQGSPCRGSPECSPGAEVRGDEGGQVQNKS